MCLVVTTAVVARCRRGFATVSAPAPPRLRHPPTLHRDEIEPTGAVSIAGKVARGEVRGGARGARLGAWCGARQTRDSYRESSRVPQLLVFGKRHCCVWEGMHSAGGALSLWRTRRGVRIARDLVVLLRIVVGAGREHRPARHLLERRRGGARDGRLVTRGAQLVKIRRVATTIER